jgi:hypothetical protein
LLARYVARGFRHSLGPGRGYPLNLRQPNDKKRQKLMEPSRFSAIRYRDCAKTFMPNTYTQLRPYFLNLRC